jgi:rhamnosyltransferase
LKRIGLAIPTYNAGDEFKNVLNEICKQKEILALVKIFDSESSDNTVNIALNKNIEVESINKNDFSHSGTRTYIANQYKKMGMDYVIFMTQDVYLQEDALKNIIDFIMNNDVTMVYGRQMVDLEKGNIFEYYSRYFNYPEKNLIKNVNHIRKLGIKTIFCSDAFAIYDLERINDYGYFGSDNNYAEDMVIADKIIKHGENIGFCADAKVYHTHNYSIRDEYYRYKETGKFHKVNQEMIAFYGSANLEGIRLVISEINFLIRNGYVTKIPESILRNIVKFIGMSAGKK